MSDNFFKIKNIIKITLIVLPVLFWIYFLVSSNLTLDTLIIFDIISIFNSIMTWNFLLFLIFLPLPSIVVLAIGINSEISESLMLLVVSFIFVFVSSLLIFKLSVFFYIFLFLYFVVHFIVALLIRKKSESGYKSLYDLTNSHLSKLTIFLVIAVFLCGFLFIIPNQKQHAEKMEIGIINTFVSDNMDPWIDTSYSISSQCTKANLDHIMQTSQFRALEKKTDPESIAFTEYLKSLHSSFSDKKNIDEIKKLYPNLDSADIKQKTLETIKSMPFMTIVENFFAFIFMIFISSFVYTYFSIVNLLYAFLIYVFNKIIEEKE